MTGLNEDPSLSALNRADVERAVVAAFEEMGANFENQNLNRDASGQGF